VTGGKNWEPAAYNPALNLIYIPSTEGCSEINGVTQADFEDQGGTHKWRDRFTGGGSKNRTQPTGSIKALDPVTGETTAIARTDLPNWSGVLATGGNLVFSGLWEGALVAYDGRTLQGAVAFRHRMRLQSAPHQLRGQRQAIHRHRGRPALDRGYQTGGAEIRQHVLDGVCVRAVKADAPGAARVLARAPGTALPH
jgi:hypothetical protein